MKVLIISTVGLKYEGITSVILSNVKAMNKEGLEIFVAGTIEVDATIRDEFEKNNCVIVDFPSRRTETMKYFRALYKFIHKNKIGVVHAHGNSATLSIELLAAWFAGCKKRIAHSHNTKCDQVKADKLLRPLFNKLYTDALACGTEAGKWLFGEKKFHVVTNGRDIEKFKFNEETRTLIRKEFDIEDKIVIGHVGGFLEQKNHSFLIEIFKAIHDMNQNTYFFLVGDGELKPEIERKVHEYDLDNCVCFTGLTNRVDQLLQGMDGMLLPSKFEGLPLVAIEWQIAGLPCVLSDVITEECQCTDLVSFCSLKQPAEEWASKELDLIKKNKRDLLTEQVIQSVRRAGFDINQSAEFLRKLYLE